MNISQSHPETMQGAVLVRPFEVELRSLRVPAPGDDEVLVKVMAVGICGSDIHYYEFGKNGRKVVERPIILGHECSGVVVATGRDVSRFSIGDRVAIEPGTTCGGCDACRSGRYNLCPSVRFYGSPPVDGAFVQYVVHREDFVFPIPDHLSFAEATLAEPLSVGIHACKRARITAGDRVAIMGMGPVGLLTVIAARTFGASEIIVTDVEEVRLHAALSLGADRALSASDSNVSSTIQSLTGGVGVDVAIETAGHPAALRTALHAVRRGGRVAIVGIPAEEEIPLNVPLISSFEVDICGVFRYANTYPQAINTLSSGTYSTHALITDQYALQQTKDALEQARTNKQSSLKVIVHPNE